MQNEKRGKFEERSGRLVIRNEDLKDDLSHSRQSPNLSKVTEHNLVRHFTAMSWLMVTEDASSIVSAGVL